MSRHRTKKLEVHRETLRIVSGPALRVVVGGLVEYTAVGSEDTMPKSNAWTGGVESDPVVISCSVGA